jgi:ABC-type multidrug transport system permease subunit
MRAFVAQFRVSLRLHIRNRMAIIYSYLFPTIFLIAFYVLYRHETVPLIRHMGELLTVTALGGACFGLPTSLVSERERGVWRRYRLTPVPTATVLASTILARYVLLLIAGLLQVVLAMGLGMPLPNHPFDLWVAFTFVAFALLGLGLVIAMLANNVPAVQALGQCIFLPMLIIGGVAVQLASLPEWAQRVSAYFPGRYAVEAMQATVTGPGLGAAGFALLALLMIGSAGFLAGAKMFRWDTEQRIVTGGGRGWVAVALGAWLAVGLLAEAQGRIAPPVIATGVRPPAVTPPPLPAPEPAPVPDRDEMEPGTPDPADLPDPEPARTQPDDPAPVPEPVKPVPPLPTPPAVDPPVARADPPETTPAPEPAPPPSAPPDGPPPPPETWRDVTRAHIDEIVFARLPSDRGVVSPIGPADEPLDPDTEAELEEVRSRLPTWGPALVDDPVQRVRNVLYVAAVPDVFQLPVERHMPHVVFERLMADIPKEDLIKILYYVATHPWGGDDSAVDDLRSVGLRIGGPQDMDQTRERVMLYALKLLGRLVGEIPW